jgi:serine/threonine-protein kinase
MRRRSQSSPAAFRVHDRRAEGAAQAPRPRRSRGWADTQCRTGDNPRVDTVTPGTLIADRYRLLRPLGTGGSATVWEAQDAALDRTVAVKLLHGFALADPTERERLRREARALARLTHPRITIVFDYVEHAGSDGTARPVLVTELLRGATLADRLRAGPLPPAEAVAVCAQLADALRGAHQAGIVHRDVKPGNAMLTRGGLKLFDFGISQAAADSDPAGSMAVGTPACMAPEQLTGRGSSTASDVYAFGCVLYWCLAGHPPYQDADVTVVARAQVYAPPPPLDAGALPPGVAELYLRCMAKDPALRPSAAEAFARLSQAGTPLSHPTLVMPPLAMPPLDGAGPPPAAARAGLAGRITSPIGLLAGAALVAAVAVGITVLLLGGSKPAGASAPPLSASTGATATASASTPSPSPSATVPTPGDPAADPVAYLEAMRGQIDGLIAQGPDVIDPNTGQDLQNSLGDLENAITAARADHGTHRVRPILDKIDSVAQKISDDADNGQIDQNAADLLTGELRGLADALSNGLSHGG